MPRSSPEAVFRTAQAAVAGGDWETFFGCLAAGDLKRLAAIGVACTIGDSGQRFTDIAVEHGASDAAVAEVRSAARRLEESATAISDAPPLPNETTLALSFGHRDLVKAYDAAAATCVASLTDLAVYVAKVERLRRETGGGGSVSSSMFERETLIDVVVTGSKAVGVRHRERGSNEPLGFARARGEWHVVLFGRASH
jgi:hypothetical protein